MEFKQLLQLNSSEADKCFDRFLSVAFKKFTIDIIKLDKILHERFGEYENQNKSMKDIVTENYSQYAASFIENH